MYKYESSRLLFVQSRIEADRGLLGTEQCCGGGCIDADLVCCPGGGWYCLQVGETCNPCPAGQICYDDIGNITPWSCCTDNQCTFIFSTGTITTSVGGGAAPSSPSSTIQTSTYTPPTTTSPPPPPPTTVTIIPGPNTPSPSPSPTPTPTTPSLPPSSPTRLITPPIITPTVPLSTSPKSTSSKASSQSSSGTINSVKFITSTITPTPSTVSIWDGSGPLLTGTCATPEFSLVDGSQTTSVFYIGVVGCVGGKTDCCPFTVSTTTATVTAAGPAPTSQLLFPSASTSSQNTLPDCPADYETISVSYCCPS